MPQNSETGEWMKSSGVANIGGMILLAAFAMGTLAQASPLSDVSLSTDGSLSMAETPGASTDSGFPVFATDLSTDLSFDACPGDDCSETDDAAVVTSTGGFAAGAILHATPLAPEPATFVLVGLTLALLPLIRKRRS